MSFLQIFFSPFTQVHRFCSLLFFCSTSWHVSMSLSVLGPTSSPSADPSSLGCPDQVRAFQSLIFRSCNRMKQPPSIHFQSCCSLDFPGGSDGKAPLYNAGDPSSIPRSGRSPGEGNGSPLQYYCLENPYGATFSMKPSRTPWRALNVPPSLTPPTFPGLWTAPLVLHITLDSNVCFYVNAP